MVGRSPVWLVPSWTMPRSRQQEYPCERRRRNSACRLAAVVAGLCPAAPDTVADWRRPLDARRRGRPRSAAGGAHGHRCPRRRCPVVDPAPDPWRRRDAGSVDRGLWRVRPATSGGFGRARHPGQAAPSHLAAEAFRLRYGATGRPDVPRHLRHHPAPGGGDAGAGQPGHRDFHPGRRHRDDGRHGPGLARGHGR